MGTYPEHEKLDAIRKIGMKKSEVITSDLSYVLGDFLAFLEDKYALCVYNKVDAEFHPVWPRTEDILGDYLGINPYLLSEEKGQMLDEIRAANDQT